MLPSKKEEIRESEEWKASKDREGMDINDLSYLCENGFRRCEEEVCLSALISGEDACMCVRSLFPSPAFYYYYLGVRSEKTEKTLEKLAYSVIGENGEK